MPSRTTSRPRRHPLAAGLLAVVAALAAVATAAADSDGDLTQLSLEELMNLEITSVSRKAERRSEAADAIYVLTREDIRRAGVRTLADALRLAPGLQVARVTADAWAVGVRGFASRLARSVLVLVDGRSVYNPLFAGTYWETLDYPIEDIERIEIIRGPGGTLWGANAFNGVINIISRSARDTQGGYVEAGAGNEERGFGTVRYGGRLGDAYYRGWVHGFNRDAGFSPGRDYDAWRMGRTGFRTDWDAGPQDALTVQGDVFSGRLGERVPVATSTAPFREVLRDDGDVSGGNVLGRWTRVFSPRSDLTLQIYYDNFYRQDPHFLERRNTGDIDFQHRYRLVRWQELIWGLGYRVSADTTRGSHQIRFDPADRTIELFSSFVQDELTLLPDRLRLTVGSKFEHNDFSGFEVQPSGRLLWTPDPRHTVWGAVSRAVRTPSRVEHDFFATGPTAPGSPTFTRVLGDEDFVSEKVVDYQLGYRVRPVPRLYVDVVPFYNEFDDLLSLEPLTPFTETRAGVAHAIVPLRIENGLHGESYGVELAADASLTEWWRINAVYSFLNLNLQHDPRSLDRSQQAAEGSSPHNMATIRSLMNLPAAFQLDLVGRYVDTLPGLQVDSYVELDARLARRFGRSLELSVVGRNLLHDHHREFAGGTEVERDAYAMVRWWW
jgi:iron complex outermembrane receptor protein